VDVDGYRPGGLGAVHHEQRPTSVRQLGAWFREGKLRPHVSQTLPLRKAAEALKLMAARQVKGKLVLTPE